MLAAIKAFLLQHLVVPDSNSASSPVERTRLAAAALLVEVVRADSQFTAQERASLFAAAARKFQLAPTQAQELIALAEAEANEATDLYQFTAEINRAYSPEQKLALLEELWRAAYADEVIHHDEEYVIRKIADLIHLPHSAFIATKLRVAQRLGRAQLS
jgi:uncharacterized tellurite resistance protein B-like protein